MNCYPTLFVVNNQPCILYNANAFGIMRVEL